MSENFNLIWGSNASQTTVWNDSDYQRGWETVGDTPPTAQQFDALQRRNDLKAQALNNTIAPIAEANDANNRKPQTVYNVGDMQYDSQLPTGWYLLCTVGGISGDGDITFPSPLTEDASVMDGTVVWRLHKLSTSVANIDSLEKSLAESTGYGIVSGCEPSISGLTVKVGAGVIHLADGTRKEIVQTNITLDAADPTNPRIDLVYIDSTGTVAKITGTAASPSVPTLPTDGISVCNVTIAAGVNTGAVTDSRDFALSTNKNVMTVKEGHFEKVVADDVVMKGPVVDVRAFGAKGDGVTDDTVAFKSAISAAEGRTLLVPHGNYLLTEPVLALECTTINRGDYAGYHLVCKLPQAPVVLKSLDRVLQKKYYAPQGDTNTQGFCYNEKTGKFLMAEITSDNATTYIHVINPETWEIENTYTYTEMPHCNILAYNPHTNKIYASSMKNSWGDIVTLNADTMVVESTVTVSPGMQTFAYDAECRVFVVPKASTTLPAKVKLFIYNESLNLLKEVQTDITINTLFNGSCAKNGRLIFLTFDGFYEVDYSGNVLSQLQTYDKKYMIFEPEDMAWAGDKLYFNANYYGVTGRRMIVYEYSFAEELYSDKDKLKTLPATYDTDLDNIVEEGTYFVLNNNTNVDLHFPKNKDDFVISNGVLKVEVIQNVFVKQIFWRCGEFTLNTNHYEIFVRSYHSRQKTWSNWVEVSSRYAMKRGAINDLVEVPPNSYVDKVVTFNSPMPSTPSIHVSIFSESKRVESYAFVTATYYNPSANGFTIRLFNGSSNPIEPALFWLAVADWENPTSNPTPRPSSADNTSARTNPTR